MSSGSDIGFILKTSFRESTGGGKHETSSVFSDYQVLKEFRIADLSYL